MTYTDMLICYRIDAGFVIKVADFGLSEDIYARNYFRQEKEGEYEESSVKLPIKWMAVESLNDGIFSKKTDVVRIMKMCSFWTCYTSNLMMLVFFLQWSFGVTCWEVFSTGKNPYPGLDPFSLIRYLERGERLERPLNTACSQEM